MGASAETRTLRQPLRVAATGFVLLCLAARGAADTLPYKIAETSLAVGGVVAFIDPSTLVAPKHTATAVRVKVSAGDRVLDAQAVEQLAGGAFTLRGELSGPGLPQAISLPQASAPSLADPFLLAIPA